MSILLYGFPIQQIFKTKYLASFFVEKTNAQFPDHVNDPEIIELVKTYQEIRQ